MPLFLMWPTTKSYNISTEKKFWTPEIPMRKNFGPTKYPEKKIFDSRNIKEKRFWTHEIPMKLR